MQQIQVVNMCEQIGHEWEAVSVVDTELVDGTQYEVVLLECLECGEEQTRLGHEVGIEED
jgi:hypothetical protein